MVLQAYFDESGIHGSAEATALSGFVGTPDEWGRVETLWKARLPTGVGSFHYIDFEERRGPWAPFERWQRDPVRDDLASILEKSELIPVSASYRGRWDEHAFDSVDPGRYPTPYSFCFEAAMEILIKCSEDRFASEPVVAMFSRQQAYERGALELFNVFKHNNEWPLLVDPVSFGAPEERAALQAADMFAYENYQALLRRKPISKDKWPLLDQLYPAGSDIPERMRFNIFHDSNSLAGVVQRGPIQNLIVPPRSEPER